MKKIIHTFFCFLCLGTSVYAQYAEPGLSGTTFTPNTVEVGQKADLTISFSNSGTTPIPVGSIEVTVSTSDNYYTSDGVTPPSGTAGDLFEWVSLGDVWRGTNTAEFPPFGGGTITLQVTGNDVTKAYEATTINVQPVKNFASFTNATANDNLTPELRIIPTSAANALTHSQEVTDLFNQESNSFGEATLWETIPAIYPNPTNDKVFIDFAGKEALLLQVYASNGQLVLEDQYPANTASHNIRLGNLPTGTYHLKLSTKDKQMVKRIEKIQ